jgi:hypothetical protein
MTYNILPKFRITIAEIPTVKRIAYGGLIGGSYSNRIARLLEQIYNRLIGTL